MRLRFLSTSHHHHTGSVFVEPVHDTGSGDTREFRIPIQQPVQQRTFPVPRAGVGDQACRLVDDDPLLILRYHAECDSLRREGAVLRRSLRMNSNYVSRAGSLLHLRRTAVQQHVSLFYPTLQAAAAMLGQQTRKDFIESVWYFSDAQLVLQSFAKTQYVLSYNCPAMQAPRMLTCQRALPSPSVAFAMRP